MTRSPFLRSGRTRRGRAAMLLMFVLIGMPTVLFAMALAVDMTMVVHAHAQARMMAEAASTAGAYEFSAGTDQVAPVLAQGSALDLVAHAQSPAGGQAVANRIEVVGQAVDVDPAGRQVTVTLDYTVTGTLVLHYFGVDAVSGTATQTSYVCNPSNPSDPVPGAGTCSRPLNK